MGELAERYEKLISDVVGQYASPDDTAWLHEQALIYAGIKELEARLAVVDLELPIAIPDDVMPHLVSAKAGHVNAELRAAAAESRALAAERRADELLAAVSELVQCSAKLTAVTRVVSIRNYADDGEWFTRLELHGPLMHGLEPGGHVAILSPSTGTPNPELLEGASVQFASAYIAAKAAADAEGSGHRRGGDEVDAVSIPCQPIPDDRTVKSIGLCRCPDCGNADCWPHYLAWEKSRGIKLNEDVHPAVDDWERRTA